MVSKECRLSAPGFKYFCAFYHNVRFALYMIAASQYTDLKGCCQLPGKKIGRKHSDNARRIVPESGTGNGILQGDVERMPYCLPP
jgi:hypothetical protein